MAFLYTKLKRGFFETESILNEKVQSHRELCIKTANNSAFNVTEYTLENSAEMKRLM